MKHKLVFLDIDGVIKPFTHPYGETFSRPHVGRVDSLVRRMDAKVVISSAWREQHTVPELTRWLAQHGLDPARIIGATPVFLRGTRGQEIAAFLKTHLRREAARVVVLDDNDSGMFDMHPMRPHLVRTHPVDGFTATDRLKAEQLLRDGPVWQVKSGNVIEVGR